MTDEELVSTAARRILHAQVYSSKREECVHHNPAFDVDTGLMTFSAKEYRRWNPLASEADVFILVDKLVSDPRTLISIDGGIGGWIVTVSLNEGKHSTDVRDVVGESPDRRRAIVIACLRAVGVDV